MGAAAPAFRAFDVGPVRVGLPGAPLLIAGPCVLENPGLTREIAAAVKEAAARHGFGCIFKGSFDKANRTSLGSYRGPGMKRGLEMLAFVREEFGLPVLTDVHETTQVEQVARVADVLQIPAFLCRQTDLVLTAAATGKPLNIKKGQFLSPGEMAPVVEKARSAGNGNVMLTERGTFFGYGRLVVDMAGLPRMRALGCPVVFDATHSIQQPGALGDRSGGERESVAALARAAAAAGCDGLFLEVHPEPAKALSDAATSLDFGLLDRVLAETAAVFRAVKL